MELVDRYILAVKQALPTNKQDDIGRELKANILDEIEALSEQSSSDDAVATVLNKYGHPDATANDFYSRPALVAGIDMPLYKKVLVHSAAFLFTYALVRTLFTMLQDDSINLFRLLFQPLFIFVDNASLLFLVVTLVFYFVGKSGAISARIYRNWSLDKLPPNPNFKISNSDTITDIITNSFVLLVLWTHLWMSDDAYQQLVITLAPSAEQWRFILTVLCVQSLLQAIYRLTQTYWQRKVYIAYIFDHAVFVIAALWMAATTPLIVVNDSLNAKLPELAHLFIESSQRYFLLSVAAILIVLMIIQVKKLSNFK